MLTIRPDLSTAAARCVAFGRDDVCGSGRENLRGESLPSRPSQKPRWMGHPIRLPGEGESDRYKVLTGSLELGRFRTVVESGYAWSGGTRRAGIEIGAGHKDQFPM
jgi:hypothetical protein